MDRCLKAKSDLKALGGKTLNLATPNGEKIEAMHLSANDFKEKINKYFNVSEQVNEDGTIQKYLHLKADYGSPNEDPNSFPWDIDDDAAFEFVDLIWNLNLVDTKTISVKNQNNIPTDLKCLAFGGPIAPSTNKHVATSDSKSNPTVLFCPGLIGNAFCYKQLAASMLLKGMDVMLFNYRGHGLSEGKPSDKNTYEDAETCFEYLKDKHNLDPKDCLAYGHCMGSAPAVNLAAKHGTNVVLDRGFGLYEDAAGKKLPLFKAILKKILPKFVNYNNLVNLPKVKGHVAIHYGTKDEIIQQDNVEKLIDHLPNASQQQVRKLMISDSCHECILTGNVTANEQFDSFLEQTGLSRNLYSPSRIFP